MPPVVVTEALVERAEALAWDYGLRGYDAVQLASAITWQEVVGTEILLDGDPWLPASAGRPLTFASRP
jgi:hypothetical protein